MATLRDIITQFNGGEVSPHMEGRVDLPKHENFCRTMQNFVPLPHGPATRRPGSKYVGETETMSEKSRLIPFRFSTTQAYVLEFGNLYMRVYMNGGRVLESTTNITGISKANPGVVTANSHGLSNGDLVYIIGVGGMTEVNGKYFTVAGKTDDTFQLSGVNTTDYTTYTGGGTVARVYTLTMPYTEAQLSEIKYTQSADTLYLVHPSHAPRKLTRTGHAAWTILTINFRPVPLKEDSIEPDATLTPSATTGSNITFTAGSAIFQDSDVHRQIISGTARAVIVSFTSPTVVLCDIIGDFASTDAIASGSWGLTGSPYGEMTPSIATPVGGGITLTTALVESVSATDDFTIVNRSWKVDNSKTVNKIGIYHTTKETIKIKIVERTEATLYDVDVTESVSHGGEGWQWFALPTPFDVPSSGDFHVGVYCPTGVTGGLKLVARAYVSGDATGDANSLTEDSMYSVPSMMVEYSDSAIEPAYGCFRAADVGKYVAINNGLVLITRLVSTMQVKGQILKELNDTTATYNWTLRIGMWDATQGWPYTVTFKDERLIFGGSDSYPQHIWGSPVGDYETFPGGTDNDNSFDFEIAAREVNVIRWLEPGRNLVIGTSGAEWVVSGGGEDSPITPTNIKVRRHRQYGSANILPLTADGSILFIQEQGEKLMEFTYDFKSDSYVAPDLTLLAEHITEGGLTALAYQKTPYSIVWGVRNDGKLVGMTYLREEEIVAWHEHPLGGTNMEVESIAVIPGTNADELWMIVKRTVNSGTVRYVEYLTDFFDGGDQEDAFYVDSGLTYDGDETPTITGLDHLEGETVKVYADGLTQASRVVSSGSITIAPAASVVQVGLGYNSNLELMRYAPPVKLGKFQGSIKRIVKLVLRLYETLSCQFGPDTSNLDSIGATELTTSLFTGDYEVDFPGGYETPGRVYIRQSNPEPLTLTAVIRKAIVERN